MTKEMLARANTINNKLGMVTAFLDQLDLTDPSGIDTTERYSPITLSCGMAQVLTLDVVNNNDPNNDVQRLDDHLRTMIVSLVKNYKQQLEKLLSEL